MLADSILIMTIEGYYIWKFNYSSNVIYANQIILNAIIKMVVNDNYKIAIN